MPLALLLLTAAHGARISSTPQQTLSPPYPAIAAAAVGDVDGDGYDDLLVGTTVGGDSATPAYVYFGGYWGLGGYETIASEYAGDEGFGQRIAGIGDVDGDGYDDFAVGSSSYSALEIWYGGEAGPSEYPDQILYGPSGSSFGGSFASAGDVNGDGYDDIVVGAPNASSNAGAVYVFLGGPAGVNPSYYASMTGSGYSGYAVAAAGDLDSDGYDDVVFGSPGYANGQTGEGRVTVWRFTGSSTSTLSFESNVANAYLGFSVTSTNYGTGERLVVAGAPYFTNGESNEGAVYFLGKVAYRYGAGLAQRARAESNVAGSKLGQFVCNGGTVDTDGTGDILALGPEYGGSWGWAVGWDVDGTTINTSTPLWSIYGSSGTTSLRGVTSGGDDFDRDGYEDVAVLDGDYDVLVY